MVIDTEAVVVITVRQRRRGVLRGLTDDALALIDGSELTWAIDRNQGFVRTARRYRTVKIRAGR